MYMDMDVHVIYIIFIFPFIQSFWFNLSRLDLMILKMSEFFRPFTWFTSDIKSYCKDTVREPYMVAHNQHENKIYFNWSGPDDICFGPDNI